MKSERDLISNIEPNNLCNTSPGSTHAAVGLAQSSLVGSAQKPPYYAYLNVNFNQRNVLGARVLSASGRQLFLIDDFRHTGRPLLSVLADKDSIFFKGLSKFGKKSLYANVVNDRSTCFYTSGISRIDPFADLSTISVNYVSGYEPVIVDPANPVSPAEKGVELPASHRITLAAQGIAKRLPRMLLYLLFIPIVLVGFLLNALFQTITSKRRIRLHEKDGEREGYHYYRSLPLLLVEEMQEAVEGVIEDIHQMQEPEHLPTGMEETAYFGMPQLRAVSSAPSLGNIKASDNTTRSAPLGSPRTTPPKKTGSTPSLSRSSGTFTPKSESGEDGETVIITNEQEQLPSHQATTFFPEEEKGPEEASENSPLLSTEKKEKLNTPPETNTHPHSPRKIEFPTLALAQSQFTMIQHLDTIGFKKFPVWIHNDAHAHAAIIVRRPWRESWAEGKVVVRHWLDGFLV